MTMPVRWFAVRVGFLIVLLSTGATHAPDTVNAAFEGGIALNETVSCAIKTNSKLLCAEQTIDMTDSAYDDAKDYRFFKAGVYKQIDSHGELAGRYKQNQI